MPIKKSRKLSSKLDAKAGRKAEFHHGEHRPHETKFVFNRKWFIENVVSLGLALLIVFMIRSSIIEAYKIPSGSMIPTLFIGDHIFVNKFAYGFKIPFSDVLTDHPVYILKREPPKRGDVIVFLNPKDESIFFIKRVIGTPGDTIELRDKVLYINQQQIARDLDQGVEADKVFKALDDPKYTASNLDIFTEHLAGGLAKGNGRASSNDVDHSDRSRHYD